MILFKEDWGRYPNAMVHLSTRNHSFLRVCELYKRIGVENYFFPLALLQPELEHVNPHDPNLDDETKILVALECRYNPWFYFREVARVPAQASSEPVQLQANRGNIAMWWSFFCHMDICLIQPRQTGKSLSTDILMEYLLDIATTNTDISMLTKDDQLRVANVDRLKEIRELVPAYLSQKTKKDSDNKHELTCRVLNNRYRTSVAQSNAISANKVGRGLTSPIVHIDEGPFVDHIDTTLPALLAAGTAARDEAEKAGSMYGNIFTTTAGKKDTRSGKYFHDMLSGGMIWTEHLYDCKDATRLHSVVEKNCTGRKTIINATFSHRQLGKSDEWLAKAIRNTNSTPEEADRDFFNIWTSGTTSSPLTTELNDIIRTSEREAKHVEITNDGYVLRWYIERDDVEHYMANNTCVLGMDTSEAIGNDATTMILVNAKTLDVVATGSFNETNIIRLISFVTDFMLKYKRVVLIPERKSTGSSLTDTMLIKLPEAGIDPFRRVFNTIVDQSSEKREEFREIQQTDFNRRSINWYDRWSSKFGFATAGSGRYSRNSLYSDALQIAARRGGKRVKDRDLINEITSLTVKKGRIDHPDNEHDDMVIAWLLVVWMLSYGKNLSYYGIESPMSETVEADRARGDEDEEWKIHEKHRQEELKEQAEALLDKIKNTQDPLLSVKYEQRLRMVDKKIRGGFGKSDSIDSLIKQAKDSQAKRLRDRRRNMARGLHNRRRVA